MFAAFRLMATVLATASLLASAGAVQAMGPRRSTAAPVADPSQADRVVSPAPPARFAMSTPRATPVPPVAPLPPEASEPALAPLPSLPSLARLHHLPTGGWFGVSLRCGDCSIRRSDRDSIQALEWRFRSEPEILSVEPGSPADHAGIKSGDAITHVGGIDITSRDGGRRFGATRPGDEVEWTIDRDGKSIVVKLKAAQRPDDDELVDQDVIRDVRRELEGARLRLRSTRDQFGNHRSQDFDENVTLAIERAQQNLEAAQRRLENSFGDSTPSSDRDAAEADAALQAERSAHSRRVRYRGDIGTSHVEVRGSSRVVVTEDGNGGLVIDTPDASIHIDKKR